MKAVIVKKPGVIEMEEVEMPEIRPQDVLVRVSCAGICGTDIDIVNGEIDLVKEGRIQYPVRIGHEWSGIVEATGSAVQNLAIGDRVISDTFVSCMECEHCLAGNYALCSNKKAVGTIDNPWPGAFAEYMCIPWYNIYKIPDNVSLDVASLVEPASIAFCAINVAQAKPEESVLIIGTGAIGLAAVGILRCKGYQKILVAGRQDVKLDIARNLGAHVVINVVKEDLKQRILEETGGKGMNVILESSGAADCVMQALDIAADGGKIILYSFYTKTLSDFPIARLSSHNISILGVPITGGTQKELLKWMSEGKLDLSPLITHRFPFEQSADIIRNTGRYGSSRIKILLEISVN